MKFTKISKSKRKFRKQLAQRPIAEKLRMLDALRDRTLAIRGAKAAATAKPLIKKNSALFKRLS